MRLSAWKPACLLSLCFALAPLWSAPVLESHAHDGNLVLDAFSLSFQEPWTIHGVSLAGFKQPVSLDLERFSVFRPDSEIIVHSRDGSQQVSPPNHAYFRGSLHGRPGARVFLTVDEGGALRGLIADGGRTWQLGGGDTPDREFSLTARVPDRLAKETVDGFQCGAAKDHRPKTSGLQAPRFSPAPLPKALLGDTYTATLAIESDFEFYHRSGGADGALDYLGDLIGAVSVIYSRELSTQLVVGHVSLWSDHFDPWDADNSVDQIEQFGAYWNQHHRQTPRTLATFLSGRNLDGGYAWIDALCSPERGYSVSSNLSGSFDLNNPFVTWDLTIVAHELGHNFGAVHSHCMEPAVDQCSDECGARSRALPCGEDGGGCGTIMSYCHLLRGGQANIALTLGLGHPYGFQPERIPQIMRSKVQAAANRQPACLPRGCTVPRVVQQPKQANLCFGDGATLHFEVLADNPRYQWYKNGQPADSGQTAFLNFSQATAAQAGSYYCVVESSCGTLTSDTVKVTVAGNSATVEPMLVKQGLKPIALRATIECNSDFSNWHWYDRAQNRSLGFANRATVTLPKLPGPTTVELRFGEEGKELVIGTARILTAGDPRFHDFNGDGCNDARDLITMAGSWSDRDPRDPDGDGRITVLDFLHLNTTDGCL